MATTTITAIRTALEAVIVALTPVGEEYGRANYERASEYDRDEGRAASDVDREFSFSEFPPGTFEEIGGSAEVRLNTLFSVTVGHAETADIEDGESRRDDDIAQIALALTSKANFPSGVQLIRFEDYTVSEYAATGERFWQTEMTFTMKYARAT